MKQTLIESFPTIKEMEEKEKKRQMEASQAVANYCTRIGNLLRDKDGFPPYRIAEPAFRISPAVPVNLALVWLNANTEWTVTFEAGDRGRGHYVFTFQE
jgi:hypothetical protein